MMFTPFVLVEKNLFRFCTQHPKTPVLHHSIAQVSGLDDELSQMFQ
jgi:hypothetical protein